MRIEIRDIESSMVYDIGPDGAILGREAAKSDIAIRDDAISKRHARIFPDRGGWFIEDLGSSNGTFVESRRIKDPVALKKGLEFSLSQRAFEVVTLEAEGGGGDTNDPAWFKGGVSSMAEETGQEMNSRGGPGFADGPAPAGGTYAEEAVGDEPISDKGFAYFMIAVPKACIHYLGAVPLIAVNPMGVINKNIREQPFAPMGKLEIAAYAMPALAFVSLFGTVAGVIASLIGGGGFGAAISGAVKGVITGAIVGVVGGIVSGIIWHPVIEWVVRFLKGESTPRSRTNYAIMFFTVMMLTAVPNGIGLIVATLPVPLLPALGPLLMLVATAVSLYFAYSWAKAFKLHKVIPIVILVLGALAVLGSLVNFARVAWMSVDTFLSSSGSSTPSGTDDPVAALEGGLTAEEREAMEKAGMTAEQIAQAEAARKMAAEATKAAMLAAKQAEEAANKAVEDAQKAADPAGKDTPAAKDPPPPPKAADPPPPPKAADPPPPPKAADPPPPPKAADPPRPAVAAPGSLGTTDFEVFINKRDAIEEAIRKDPSIIFRKDVRADYEDIWRTTYDIRDKFSKKKGKRWERDKIEAREKDLEIFNATRKAVDRVYDRIFK